MLSRSAVALIGRDILQAQRFKHVLFTLDWQKADVVHVALLQGMAAQVKSLLVRESAQASVPLRGRPRTVVRRSPRYPASDKAGQNIHAQVMRNKLAHLSNMALPVHPRTAMGHSSVGTATRSTRWWSRPCDPVHAEVGCSPRHLRFKRIYQSM